LAGAAATPARSATSPDSSMAQPAATVSTPVMAAPPVASSPAAAPASAAAAAGIDTQAPWSRHAQWMSVRAGYAKISAEGAPDGLAGYGFGYARFIMNRWSVGGYVHHELLG